MDVRHTGEQVPVETRLRRALFWIGLIEQATFDAVRGERLDELLQLITQAAVVEVPDVAAELGPPSALGRTQFRLLAGHYARKDTYGSGHGSLVGRMKLLRSALKLTSGRGVLPPLQDAFREVPFAALEQPFGALPAEADDLLTRYFAVKLHGMHFCGPAYYKVPLVEGFYSLALVYPAVLWIARWLAASAGRNTLQQSDVEQALTIADHHHGYSPAFGTWGFRRRVKTLAQMGDIPRLCAWYSR